jgi:plasmid stabilization system protein ParE
MAYKVIWSDEAITSFESSIKYLETNFSGREINNFTKATNDKVRLIGINPLMYRKSSRHSDIHYTNILGKVILVYRIQPRTKVVELIHFWDGRQNPKRFKI